MMTVEYPQAPRRHHQQPRTGEQHLHDPDRELTSLSLKPWRDQMNQPGRTHEPQQYKQRDCTCEDSTHRPCNEVSRRFVAFAQQSTINRYEWVGQHALAKLFL